MLGRFFKGKDNSDSDEHNLIREYEEQMAELEEQNITPHYDPRERLKKLDRQQRILMERSRPPRKKVFALSLLLVAMTYAVYLVATRASEGKELRDTPFYEYSERVEIYYDWANNSSESGASLLANFKLKEGAEEVRVSSRTVFEILLYNSSEELIFSEKFVPGDFVITEKNPLLLKTQSIPIKTKEQVIKIEMASENYINSKKSKKSKK